MKTQPKFSIVIANYNYGRYIEEAIKSVFSQTYSNWEIIVVDDGSTDNSVVNIKKFLPSKRIKLFELNKNMGCGYAKDYAIKKSNGDIVGILDSDDCLSINCLEEVVLAYNKESEAGMIYTTSFQCDSNLEKKKITDWVGALGDNKTNLHESRIDHFLTFRKELYSKTVGINNKLRSAVDKDLIYKLEEVTQPVFLDKPLYYRRDNDKGISQKKQEADAYLNCVDVMFDAFKRRKGLNFNNLSNRKMSEVLMKASLLATRRKKYILFVIFILRGIVLCPRNILLFYNFAIRKLFIKKR
ncbi:hypothetical protein C0584_01565 [Candidatus Parcubacteria bacterium]|nr:MAG: hypothetical protein C0584_01565 [Candidatus Parcubacteria bacterium]